MIYSSEAFLNEIAARPPTQGQVVKYNALQRQQQSTYVPPTQGQQIINRFGTPSEAFRPGTATPDKSHPFWSTPTGLNTLARNSSRTQPQKTTTSATKPIKTIPTKTAPKSFSQERLERTTNKNKTVNSATVPATG